MIWAGHREHYMGSTTYPADCFRLNSQYASATGMNKINDMIARYAEKMPQTFEGSFKSKFRYYRAVD
ncbi:hypothetical protein G6F56_014303 [Rhizopus delemar]|nr:hypothetical protein G6F56_014303 [Rhizopus delemar]